jgi:prophage regulatory protein
MKTGDFPHSISLGLRSIGWIESEVQAWIDSKIAVTRNQAGVDL